MVTCSARQLSLRDAALAVSRPRTRVAPRPVFWLGAMPVARCARARVSGAPRLSRWARRGDGAIRTGFGRQPGCVSPGTRVVVRTRAVADQQTTDQKLVAKQQTNAMTLNDVLCNVRTALRVVPTGNGGASSGGASSNSASSMIWGIGSNLGMPTRWSLRCAGGSFVDEAHGTELSYTSGHCHGKGDASLESLTQQDKDVATSSDAPDVWETDFSGYTQTLKLDDREAALLSAWTRTHFWVTDEAKEVLEMELLVDSEALTDNSEVLTDSAHEELLTNNSHDFVTISCRLKNNGLLFLRISVSTKTWLPVEATLKVCGDLERWSFSGWRALEHHGSNRPGPMFPTVTTLTGSAGGKQVFTVTGARANAGVAQNFFKAPGFDSSQNASEFAEFAAPTTNANSGGVSFAKNVPPEVSITRARSAHVLVRPLVNGIDVGPFILDTGASGLVITSKAAETLRLKTFGEVFVSGVAGKVPCRFRRATTLTLGPLEIADPVFMEMALGGIVSGCDDPVAGIVGFDVFKSAVVEVGPGGSPVRLYDPATFTPHENWIWHPLTLVSNVPHVTASFAGMAGGVSSDEAKGDLHSQELSTDQTKRGVVFMIDSGAGGADAIFHKRAVDQLGLLNLLPADRDKTTQGASKVRGVGGTEGESSGATRAHRTTLDWLELSTVGSSLQSAQEERSPSAQVLPSKSSSKNTSNRSSKRSSKTSSNPSVEEGGGYFSQLDVLLATDAGFDLSEHAVGLICANVLRKRRVVYDVPNRRIALLTDGVDAPPCESIMCAVNYEVGYEWSEDDGGKTNKKKERKNSVLSLPTPPVPFTPKELNDFDECVRFGTNE